MELGMRKGKIFYGWWIVGAGFLISLIPVGAWYYGFGVLFKPIMYTFGWSRAQVSLARTLATLEGGLEAYFVGWAVDKWGSRKIVLFGVFWCGLGFIALSFVNSLWSFYFVCVGMIIVGLGAGGYNAMWPALALWFNKKRGRAMGFLAAGGGAAGIMASIMAWLILQYGWRMTVVIIGIAIWIACIPLSLVFRRWGPEHYGLQPDGELPGEESMPTSSVSAPVAKKRAGRPKPIDFTLGEAVRTSSFWLLLVAWGITTGCAGAYDVHASAIVTDLGASAAVGALAITVYALIKTPARIILPWLADIYEVRYMLAISFSLMAVSMVLLAGATTVWMVFSAGLLLGFGFGASLPLAPAMMGAYYGGKHFGKINGLRAGLGVVISMGYPLFTGWVYDVTQSYSFAYMVLSIACAIGVVLILFARYPARYRETAAT